MIEFRTLGSLSLRDTSGAGYDGVLAQPKRAALLAYLAVNRPGEFVRRDLLLPIFWIELDQDRARRALSQALYVLRTELGDDVVITRGAEEVRLNLERVWCDATAFRGLVADGQGADALALYRGELLDGFFISGAPAFDRWVDSARATLTEMAVSTARELSTRADSEGNLGDAVCWARRAHEIAPDDEVALRELLAMLARAGDRAGLLRLYEEFRARLETEYELEPDEETVALVRAVVDRRGNPGVVVTPERIAELADAVSPSHAPAHATQARWPRIPRFRVALAGGSLAVLAVFLALARDRRPDAIDPTVAGSARVTVLPFDVRGSRQLDYLRTAIPDLLAASLEGVPGLTVVDDGASDAANGQLDLRRSRAVAAGLGADLFITGAVTAAGPALNVEAALYDIDGRRRATAVAVATDSTQVFVLVSELARELLGARRMGTSPRLTGLAASTTASLEAYKAYLKGDRSLRPGRFEESIDWFQAAIKADSTFALAHFLLSIAAAASGDHALARDAAEASVRFSNGLSSREHRLFNVQLAVRRGDAGEAERLCRALLAVHPDDIDAWFLLGYTLYRQNAMRGRSMMEARAALQRVLSLAPDYGPAVLPMLDVFAKAHQYREYRALLDRSFTDREPPVWRNAVLVFGEGGDSDRAQMMAELANAPDGQVQNAARVVSVHVGDLVAATRIAEILTRPERAAAQRVRGLNLLAQLEVARGRWRAADGYYRSAEKIDSVSAVELRAYGAAMPFSSATEEEMRQLRSRLSAWNVNGLRSLEPSTGTLAEHGQQFLRPYLVGLLSARLRDRAGVVAARAEVAARRGPEEWQALARALLRTLDAFALQLSGDIRGALAVLEQEPVAMPERFLVQPPFFARLEERFLRGQLLSRTGREAEAIGWFTSLGEQSIYSLAYAAPAQLEIARALERIGKPADAERAYAGFVETWKEADSVLQPVVASARTRAAELGAGRR